MKDIQLILDIYFLNQYSLDKVNINVSAISSSLFDFYSLNLFNECYIICSAKKEIKYKQSETQYQMLSENRTIIFYLNEPSNYLINCLTRDQVPFISNKGQIFLPKVYMNLFQTKPRQQAKYTKSVQQLVQFYFFEENVYYSLHEIQKQLSLSTSTISRANLFLFDIGVLQRKGSGTRAQYKRIDLKSFYDNMKPYLLNPIKEYCYIRISDLNQEDVVARSSDSALSFCSSVVEEVPACVIRKECYQKYKDISIHENEIEEFNGLIRIENYYYLPEYLKNQFINILDIISIYKDSYDNRIQIEIEELEDKLNDERFRQNC